MCFSTAGIREKFTIPLGRRNTKSRDIPSRHIPREEKKGSVKRSLLGFLGPSSFFFFRFLRFSFSLVHGHHRFVHSERICCAEDDFFLFPLQNSIFTHKNRTFNWETPAEFGSNSISSDCCTNDTTQILITLDEDDDTLEYCGGNRHYGEFWRSS